MESVTVKKGFLYPGEETGRQKAWKVSDVRDNDVRDDVGEVGKFSHSGYVEGYK